MQEPTSIGGGRGTGGWVTPGGAMTGGVGLTLGAPVIVALDELAVTVAVLDDV